MARKPKATSPKTAPQKGAVAKAATGASEKKDKSAARRPAAKPPAPGADDGGEFASPACSAHEVDPSYMMASAKPVPSAPAGPAEKPKTESASPQPAPDANTGKSGDAPAAKAPAKPARPVNQPPKPSWADRHGHAPRSHGQGRMRVGRPHGRGQGG